jgi:glycosyltransferase involved in cell wall biosynthesis
VTGDAALLFEPTDETGLANLLQQITSDPGLLNALSITGPEQAARFSWRKTAEDTLAVYEQVLGIRAAVHG